MTLIFLTLVISASLAYGYRTTLSDKIGKYMLESMKKYKTDDVIQGAWNQTQIQVSIVQFLKICDLFSETSSNI